MYFVDPPGQLELEFWRFHQANPQVYAHVKSFARVMLERGHTTFAIACIWERVRWELSLALGNGEEFVLPNNHRAYYARLWLREHPEHPEFFRVAQLRSVHPMKGDRYGRVRSDD